MKPVPGTLHAERVPFGTTHWSVVLECSHADGASSEEAQAALAALCRQYWAPLYSFVRRRGYRPPDAQDLTQEFFAYLLENRLYCRADPSKGRFRSFLIILLKRFLSDAAKRENSQKRGGAYEFLPLGAELDAFEARCLDGLAGHGSLDEERSFERQWAETLVRSALDALGAQYAREFKAGLFEHLRGFLTAGDDLPTQEEVAVRLQMPAATLRSYVSRLRVRYRAALRIEVARTVSQDEDIDEELRYLCQVLLRA